MIVHGSCLTDDQVREYARTALLAYANNYDGETDLDETITDETGDRLDEEALAQVYATMEAATIVVLLPGDLAEKDARNATPAPWTAQVVRRAEFEHPYAMDSRKDAAMLVDPALRNLANPVSRKELVYPVSMMGIPDARLIAALRNAYAACTTLPETTVPTSTEENRA